MLILMPHPILGNRFKDMKDGKSGLLPCMFPCILYDCIGLPRRVEDTSNFFSKCLLVTARQKPHLVRPENFRNSTNGGCDYGRAAGKRFKDNIRPPLSIACQAEYVSGIVPKV